MKISSVRCRYGATAGRTATSCRGIPSALPGIPRRKELRREDFELSARRSGQLFDRSNRQVGSGVSGCLRPGRADTRIELLRHRRACDDAQFHTTIGELVDLELPKIMREVRRHLLDSLAQGEKKLDRPLGQIGGTS